MRSLIVLKCVRLGSRFTGVHFTIMRPYLGINVRCVIFFNSICFTPLKGKHFIRAFFAKENQRDEEGARGMG